MKSSYTSAPRAIDTRAVSRRLRDILRRDKFTTREGKARILRMVEQLERAEVLLNELAAQIRPTTLPSSRAYAAQRTVEEWTGREIGEEACADDMERLAAMPAALTI